jgi:hypothetical protein
VATNLRGSGKRITVKAAAVRTSGVAAVDENIAGFPINNAAENALYPTDVSGVWEIAFIGSSVKGDRVDITDATGALVRVAYGGAVGTGNRKFGTIVAVPGDGETTDVTQAPKTGFMWIKLLPQASHTTLAEIVVTQVTHGEAGHNQKDTVTLPAGTTGGTFTLTAEGETTAAIPFNATAAEVKAAMVAKTKLIAGVEVTGAAGGPYTVEFLGATLKEKAITLTASGENLSP